MDVAQEVCAVQEISWTATGVRFLSKPSPRFALSGPRRLVDSSQVCQKLFDLGVDLRATNVPRVTLVAKKEQIVDEMLWVSCN